MLYFNKQDPSDVIIFVSDKLSFDEIKVTLKGEVSKGVVTMQPPFTIYNNQLTIDKSQFIDLENDIYYLEILINTDGEDKVIGADFLDVFNKKVAKTFYESYINYKQYEKHD
jgi:hypothetical protein